MNEELMQEGQELDLSGPEELTPEEAKASLGLATRFGEQFLMSQVPQEEMVEAEPQEEKPKTVRDEYEKPQEDDAKLDEVLNKISQIEEQINEALKDEGQE